MRKKREKKQTKERKLQRVRKEVFRATKVIYIEPFASRPPPTFWKSSESFGQGKNIEQKNFEVLKCATTMGERLEKTLKDLWRQILTPTLAFAIINDCEEEKQIEWHVEVEQPTKFSLVPNKGGFSDVKVGFHNILVVTKSQSKYMMRQKGKEQVEEGNSPPKITQKQAPTKAKEIQKMF